MNTSYRTRSTTTRAVPILFILACLLSVTLACQTQQRLFAAPTPTGSSSSAAPLPTPTPITPAPEQPPTAPPPVIETLPGLAGDLEPFACGFTPVTARILGQTSASRWIDWIEKLSGAEPVVIDGVETTITTRFSQAMFDGLPHARAFDYVLQTVGEWYPPEQIEAMEYSYEDSQGRQMIWKNLVVTLPGTTRPDEVVILSAHLDSISSDPMNAAPGAADNGSGSAALLEAARIFSQFRFERTIEIVWFTGEELGLHGSRAYVEQIEQPALVQGALNLDMFGYDSDNDRCFEMHVGQMPESQRIGRCMIESIEANQLDLPRYDYLSQGAIGASDHRRFWDAGIGAVEILEDLIPQQQPGGCLANDPNPGYHSPQDTVEKLNPTSGVEIVRAALATVAGMAIPVE